MDSTRNLDAKGIAQVKEMAAFLTKQIGRVDICICSTDERAIETAKIMADALGCYAADSRMLRPDGTPSEMWAEIARLAQQSKDVLVVGHDPSINALLEWLMGDPDAVGDYPNYGIRFEHASIAWLKVTINEPPQNPEGQLQWLVTPVLIHRDESEDEVIEAARQLQQAL